MENQLIVSLFESHLNTISIILGGVGVIFVVFGIVSYSQIMKHIKQTIDSTVQERIQQEVSSEDIKVKIEEALNKKIENYNIIIHDVVDEKEKNI